jgi:hypothetical protein
MWQGYICANHKIKTQKNSKYVGTRIYANVSVLLNHLK